MTRVSALLFAAVLISSLGATPASRADSLTDRVDQLFAEWNKPDAPGCSIGISRGGALVYERGYGTANIDLAVPITPATVLDAASISKQFTAMSILLLAQPGKLSVDDDVSKHIPGWAMREPRVTIRHLLTHTGGLRDAFTLLGMSPPREDGVPVNDVIERLLARQRGLNFPPGTKYEYNNGGYSLLASIVKRVSGQSLQTFADAHIFKPLGMTHTRFVDEAGLIVANRATGYSHDASGFHIAGPGAGVVVGNAGLFTTAGDLLRWEQNFADARIGNPALLAAMQAPTLLAGGNPSQYGFGLELGLHRGLRTVGHGGGGPGVSAYVVRYPEQQFAVALLCNRGDIAAGVGSLTQRIAEIYLVAALAPSTTSEAAPKEVALSLDQLTSRSGLYRDAVSGDLLRLLIHDGKLAGSLGAGDDPSFDLAPVNEHRFVIRGMTSIAFEFLPRTNAGQQEVHVFGAQPQTLVLRRLAEVTVSSTALRALAGSYRSPELDVTYTLVADERGLTINVQGRGDIALKAIAADTFAASVLGVVTFLRDAHRTVTGFTADSTNVRGLRFDRVKR
jgi:CubicO group peptidase (beta-lactamase class C family)